MEKKTDVKKIAGGTKTTVTNPDGSKTFTNEISSREDHQTYKNSKDYDSSQSTSSFKR